MKYRITYRVNGMDFTAGAETISRAYDYIRAIVQKEDLRDPDLYSTLSEWMRILVFIATGQISEYQNHVITVELINKS